jgi:hypothetical protein
MVKILGLTLGEWRVVEHRLEVGDAIADCLEEYARDDVLDVVACLSRQDLGGAEAMSSALTRDVLADCIEGSTWLAPDPHNGHAIRQLKQAAMKIEAYVGRTLDVPRC